MRRASEIKELSIWGNSDSLQIANVKKAIRQAWKRAFGDICQSCQARMHFEVRYRSHRHYATIDHIEARGLGGSNTLENIQVICKECNNLKSKDEYHRMPPNNS